MKRKRKLSLQDYYNVATREMVVIFTSHLSRKWTGLLGIDCSAHIHKIQYHTLPYKVGLFYLSPCFYAVLPCRGTFIALT